MKRVSKALLVFLVLVLVLSVTAPLVFADPGQACAGCGKANRYKVAGGTSIYPNDNTSHQCVDYEQWQCRHCGTILHITIRTYTMPHTLGAWRDNGHSGGTTHSQANTCSTCYTTVYRTYYCPGNPCVTSTPLRLRLNDPRLFFQDICWR